MEPNESLEGSLYYHLARTSRKSNGIYQFMTASLILLLSLLPILKVQIGVSTTGMIRSTDPVHTLRAPVDGTLKFVALKENLSVHRGDTLGILQSDLIQRRLSHTEQKIEELRQRETDWDQILSLVHGDTTMTVQNSHPEIQDALVYNAWLAWREEFQLHQGRVKNLQEILSRDRKLAERKFISREELQSSLFDLQQARLQLDRSRISNIHEWRKAREATDRHLLRLYEERQQLRDELDRTVLIAPFSGTLQDVASLQAGGRIHGQQVLARLTPDGELMAELYMSPDDIGWVRAGMPVRIQVDAFDSREWGLIEGAISSIPEDITMSPAPHYQVRATLNKTTLELENGFRGHLRKGMTLKGRLLITERTLLQLLFDRIEEWMDPRWSDSSKSAGTPTLSANTS